MRHSCISFLSISLFLLTACSGEKGSHDQVSTVSIDKGVEHFDADYTSAQYQSLFKNPKTIRLETNDKCLLSANAYLLNVTPKYIVIGDKTSFYFFNAENGSFLSVMDRQGFEPITLTAYISATLLSKFQIGNETVTIFRRWACPTLTSVCLPNFRVQR